MARFHILTRPSRMLFRKDITNVMKTCVVLPNMVLENCRDGYESVMCALQYVEEAHSVFNDTSTFQWASRSAMMEVHGNELPEGLWASMVASRETRMTSKTYNHSLQHDLVENVLDGTAIK